MSKSTLPDLFKADMNEIKYHFTDRPRKIGGRFTITNLNNKPLQHSPQKSPSSILKNKRGTSSFAKPEHRQQFKKRSHSNYNIIPTAVTQQYQALKQKGNLLQLSGKKKSVKFSNNAQSLLLNSRRHSEIVLMKQANTLQQIYYKNLVKNNRILTSTTRQTGLGFPYQTTRSMNNMKIYMEEADSFKNRVESMIQTQIQSENILNQTIVEADNLKNSLQYFKESYSNDLKHFYGSFLNKCQQLTKKLSNLRRQTGQQTKINMQATQSIYHEVKDAGLILQVLQKRTNVLRNQCLDDQKLQLTNNKTTSFDIERKLGQSIKQDELNRLFGRSYKRSQTSHQNRNRMTSRDNQSALQRGQTTSNVRKNQNRLMDQQFQYEEDNIRQQQQLNRQRNMFKDNNIKYEQQGRKSNRNEFEDSLDKDQNLIKQPRKFILNGQETEFLDF